MEGCVLAEDVVFRSRSYRQLKFPLQLEMGSPRRGMGDSEAAKVQEFGKRASG